MESKEASRGRPQLLVEGQGRLLCLPSLIARVPKSLWSVLQHKSILDVDETLPSKGEISATIQMIVYLGLRRSRMLLNTDN